MSHLHPARRLSLAGALLLATAVITVPPAGPAAAAPDHGVLGWVEAEDMTREGGVSGSGPHNNQSGLGFITIREPPEGLRFTVDAPDAGTQPVWIRYANGDLGGGSPPNRTISLLVNGSAAQITLPPSTPYDWETWEVFRTEAALQAGANELAIRCIGDDECHLNIDVVQVGGTTFDPACPATDPGAGYTAMFDGTFASLDMWRKGDHYGSGGVDGGVGLGRQADCTVQTAGGSGSEWFLGPQPGASPPLEAPYTLRLDFLQHTTGDDSGVFLGSPDHGNTPSGGLQVDLAPGAVGAIAGVQPADTAAVAEALRPPGQWNGLALLVEAHRVRVVLNGRLVNAYSSGPSLSGYVGLEFAGDPNKVSFRAIRYKPGVAPDAVPTTTAASAVAGAARGTVVVTATVRAASGTPAGAVTVGEAGIALAAGVLDATGAARISLAGLAAGHHTLSVAYAGDDRHLPSSTTASVVVPGAEPEPEPEPEGAVYTATEPSRLLDSRSGGATVDGRFAAGGRLGAGSVTTLRVAGRGGIPADATAAVLNVTATDTGEEGYLTVWPCDAPRPAASSVNFAAGATVPNTVVAGLDGGGYACIYTSAPTQVVVDGVGYLPEGHGYAPVVPARLIDTRDIGAPAPGYALRVPVAGRGGVPPDAVAAALNLTVTGATGGGYLTVWPCGGEPPATSSLNYRTGQTVANAVVSGLGAAGEVCVYVGESTAHVVIDVNGWFAVGAGLHAVAPQRLLDSRRSGAPAAGYTVKVAVAGDDGVPASATSAVLNLTAVDPAGAGYLTVYRCGDTLPNASNVNYVAGANTANLVVAPLDPDGIACIHVAESSTGLLVDVNAWLPG